MQKKQLSRSPELMSAVDTALLLIDVQQKLIPVINHRDVIVWNIRRLLDAARILDVKILSTEQNPLRLGQTIDALAERIDQPAIEKMNFSSAASELLIEQLQGKHLSKVLICGIETHVCVQQTALDLITAGFQVFVAVDAVGSRNDSDHEHAISRLRASSVTITTTEAVIFEWCERADRPEFKAVSSLVKESKPVS